MEISVQGVDAIVLDFKEKPTQVTRALFRAMNRAVASGRTVMVREIARDVRLKSRDVRDAIRLEEASPSRLTARISASIKRIPLIDFNAKMTRGRGVTARLPPPGAGRYPHAFIATMTSGHVGVFQRVAKARLPIRELYGPSLGNVFSKYRPLGVARVEEVLMKNFDHEMKFAATEGGADGD